MSDLNSQFLNAVITLSMGLAALISLVSIFRTPERFDSSDIVEFKSILISCLFLAIGGILPFAIGTVYAESGMWAISSIAYSVVSFSIFLQIQSEIAHGQLKVQSGFVSLFMRVITVVLSIATLLNGLIIQESPIYLIGLFWGVSATIVRLYVFLLVVMHFNSDSD